MEQAPKVELGKETRKEILAALKNIKMQISTAKQRESTAPDVAADVLASGGGPFAAMKEALAFKSGKVKAGLKHHLDPLNIINRMTGGSKITTVLAGKLMGRSEKSIRSAAGLQPIMEGTVPTLNTKDTDATPVSTSPTQENSSRTLTLFEQIAKGVAFIANRVNGIAVKMGAIPETKVDNKGRLRDKSTGRFVSGDVARQEAAQTSLLNKLVAFATSEAKEDEKENDAKVESDYEQKFKKITPTRVSDTNSSIESKSSSGGVFGWIWGLLKGAAMSFLGLVSGALLKSGKMIGGLLMEGLAATKFKIGEFLKYSWEGIKGTGGAIGKGASIVAKKAAAIGASALAMAGIKPTEPMTPVTEMATKAPAAPTSKVPAPLNQAPAAPTTSPTRVSKLTPKEAIQKVASKVVGKTALKAIPFLGGAIGLGSALYQLSQGDLTQATIDAGMGMSSLTGIGAAPAFVGGIIGSLANAAYKEMYGVDPMSDPLFSQRLPELTDAAKTYVADQVIPKAEIVKSANQLNTEKAPNIMEGSPQTIPTKTTMPSEVSSPAPTTGTMLQAHADFKADIAGARGVESESMGANITNIRNNQVHSSMISQTIASPRSSESTFLRLVDRNYAIP